MNGIRLRSGARVFPRLPLKVKGGAEVDHVEPLARVDIQAGCEVGRPHPRPRQRTGRGREVSGGGNRPNLNRKCCRIYQQLASFSWLVDHFEPLFVRPMAVGISAGADDVRAAVAVVPTLPGEAKDGKVRAPSVTATRASGDAGPLRRDPEMRRRVPALLGEYGHTPPVDCQTKGW